MALLIINMQNFNIQISINRGSTMLISIKHKVLQIVARVLKSQIFTFAIAPLILFTAICFVLLCPFWFLLEHIWVKLYGLFNWNQQSFFYFLSISFVVINVIALAFSLKFIKNKRHKRYFNVLLLTLTFAVFFSLLLMHLYELCYI